MPRITQSTEVIEVNENGEITHQTSSKTINHGTEPEYIKLYLQDILYLSDMPKQYSAALMALMRRVSYAGDEYGMCIILAPVIRKAICQELGLKNTQSLKNILTKLVKGEILFSVAQNVYRLNPYLFGRGTWSDISKIRLEVNYYPETGRTFQTTLEHNLKRAKQPIPGQLTIDTQPQEPHDEEKAS